MSRLFTGKRHFVAATAAKDTMMAESNATDLDGYIKERYESAIRYYWAASKRNKRWYKVTRALTVIFGALVTLVASLSSSEIIQTSGTFFEKMLGGAMPDGKRATDEETDAENSTT